MIKPHGSNELNPLYIDDDEQRAALVKEAEKLPSMLLNSAAAANAVMLWIIVTARLNVPLGSLAGPRRRALMVN